MSQESFKVRSVGDEPTGHVRISVDSAGEEARGVTMDPRDAIAEIAGAAGLVVTIEEPDPGTE